jgi:hypothetical protein
MCTRELRFLLLILVFAAGCPADSPGGLPDGALPDGATPDGTTPDAAPAACPGPKVFCDRPPPACPAGSAPVAEPCPNGHCPGRCYTGACAPCASECQRDSDCRLVGRHGCCGPAGDCAMGCFWAAPAAVLSDPCYFAAGCPVPRPPAGCPMACTMDPRCVACPHCSPHAARCEGGRCVSAWTRCEPNCFCR